MKNKLWKKGLVLGMILLFVGASILPVVNSMQIQNKQATNNKNNNSIYRTITKNEGNYVEDPEPLPFPILERFCTFEIQFFGDVTRDHPIQYGDLTIYQRATSTDSSGGNVALLTVTNSQGNTVVHNIPRMVIFRGYFIFGLLSDIPAGQTQHTGFIKGWAMFLMVRWG